MPYENKRRIFFTHPFKLCIMNIGGSMKKITILVLHLGFGGIEKAVTSLANLLCKEYKVTIVSTYKLEESPSFEVNSQVTIKYLIESDLPKKVENYKLLFFRLQWGILCKTLWQDYIKKGHLIELIRDGIQGLTMYSTRKKAMIEYIKSCEDDIMISTREIHNELLATYGSKEALKIGWEHNHPNGNVKYSDSVTRSAKNLDYLVLVSKELYQFYEKELIDAHCRPIYIPNFIDQLPKEPSPVESNHLITVGRLSKEKGHKDLIEVMHLVRHLIPDFHLDIIGEGPERETIEKEIVKYDLSDKICLRGFLNRREQEPYLKKASIFILPSFTESFGLVILEAFAYGIPCIAFTSAQGAKEIVKDNWDGYLIEDRNKEKMAKRVVELLRSYNRRYIMGNNALKKAKQYTGANGKKDWVSLLEKEK